MLAATLVGCGTKGPSEAVLEARVLFQRGQIQAALDLLQSDSSAESRYLQAVALDALRMPDAAREQIDLAVKGDSKNAKYRGYQLRLQLYEGKQEAVEELLRLHQENRSSAAAALFAFGAHGARWSQQRSRKQWKEAAQSGAAARAALREAIALHAQIPEFQREMLELTIAFQLGEEAELLSARLREAFPNDPELAKEHIDALLRAGRADVALEQARALYHEKGRDEEAAMVFATALAKADATSEHDREFRGVVDGHPLNAAIVSQYAAYLAKSKRLTLAAQVLQDAIAKQPHPAMKRHLMRIAVYVPLEEGAADIAEAQLKQYRREIADPLLMAYFEGRLLYLRKDHSAALAKLTEVVERQKDSVDGHRPLAREALTWIERILADQAEAKRLGQASDAVRDLQKAGVEQSEVKEKLPRGEKGLSPRQGSGVLEASQERD